MPSYRYSVNIAAGEIAWSGDKFSNMSISLKENEPTTWSFTVSPDPDRDFDPWKTDATYRDVITPDIFSDEFTVNRAWRIYGTIGNTSWGVRDNFPWLILTDVNRNSNKDGFTTVFNGIDFSRNLIIENQSKDSYVSTPSKIYYAKEIIEDILDDVRIDYRFASDFEDFPVKDFHMQGITPLDAIKQLIDINGACFRFEGKKIFFYKPQSKYNNTTQNWTLNLIFDWSATKSVNGLKNEVVVGRTDSTAKEDIIEGNEGGIRVHQLSMPKISAQFHVLDTKNGQVSTNYPIEFLDESGASNLLGGYSGVANSVRFVFEPSIAYAGVAAVVDDETGEITSPAVPGNSSIPIYYKAKVTGKPANMAGIIDGIFDDTYSVTVKDEVSQSQYGKLPAAENLDNPLIPNKFWAKIYGERWLMLQKRNLDTMTATIPFNPKIKPSDVVYIPQLSNRYYITQVDHSLSLNSATTRLSGGVYDISGMEIYEAQWRNE